MANIRQLQPDVESTRAESRAVALLHSPPGPIVRLDDRDMLYFSGTSYLGLHSRPEVIAAIATAAANYGVHAATSRVRAGVSPALVSVERAAAEYFATETAVHCASGYLSPWLLLQAVLPAFDRLILDRRAHAALRDAAACSRLPVETVEVSTPGIEFASAMQIAAAAGARPLVLCDGVLSATGELAGIDQIVSLLSTCDGAGLLIDDAHGWGVIGSNGRGVFDAAGLWARVNRLGTNCGGPRLFACGTLGKALGGYGGIVPCDRALADAMAARSSVYSAAAPPAAPTAAASAVALEIALREPGLRARLATNLEYLDRELRVLACSVQSTMAPIRCITHTDADVLARAHEHLLRARIYVPHVRGYGGSGRTGVLRIAVFSDHERAHIDGLVAALRAAGL